jgi:hypothetical protein
VTGHASAEGAFRPINFNLLFLLELFEIGSTYAQGDSPKMAGARHKGGQGPSVVMKIPRR